MLELIFVGGLIAAVLALPLVLLGWALKLVFHIVLLPFQLLGALFGLGIAAFVLTIVGIVLFLVFGVFALAGLLVCFGPLLLVALVLWAILRSRRRGNRPTAAA